MALDPLMEQRFNDIAAQWGDDEEGMSNALDRAHESGGADNFGVLAALGGAPEAQETPMRLRKQEAEPVSAPMPKPPTSATVSAPALVAQARPMGGSSPDWAQIADQLKYAESARGQNRAYENLFANVAPGYKPNIHAGEDTVNIAKQPLELANARQAYEAKDMGMQAQKSALGVKAADADPSSMQSQKARESIKTFFSGMQLPAGFDNWSAADISRWAKSGDLSRLQLAKAASEERAAKSAASNERLSDLDARHERERAENNEWRKTQHADAQANAAAGRAIAARGLEAKASEAASKKSEDVPPEYEIAPDGNPSADSRKKFTALVTSQRKLKNLTAQMRKEMEGVGTLDKLAPGQKRDRLNQLATQIGIEGKNVAELGALSGPDMDLMNAMVKNPTSAINVFSNMASNMDGLDSWADESVKAGEAAYGIRKKAQQASPGAGPIKMKFPDGSVHDVDSVDLEMAKERGGVPTNGR